MVVGVVEDGEKEERGRQGVRDIGVEVSGR